MNLERVLSGDRSEQGYRWTWIHGLLLSACCLLLTTCTTYVPVAQGDNFAYIYGKGAAAIRLQARVYHASENRSVIWFKLRTRDLLYRSEGGGPFRARVVLKYEAWPTIAGGTLLDSASTFVKDVSDAPKEDKDLIGSMEMKRNEQRSFVLKVTAHDLNRDTESTVFIPVERGVPGHRQDFLPLSERGIPLFDDNVPAGMRVRVLCEQYAGRTLVAERLELPRKLPAPVFAPAGEMPSLQVDSTYTVSVGEDGAFLFNADTTGMHYFRTDTGATTGYALFTFQSTYPSVRTAPDMVPPLRYITSQQEWDRIRGADDVRQEVEKFWTDAAGDRDRARAAIDAYYGRVESANRWFTSWTEGWRTDRGLVHIIFGTPSTIHKNGTGEVWIYGEETNLMSLTFTFDKREGPFSDNDLTLRRDPTFKGAWYRNVEAWRNGRVFQN